MSDIKNGMIKKITEDNVDEYESIIPPDVAENVWREHHKGIAFHEDEDDEPQAILMCATTGAGWDGDDKELIIEWIYSVDNSAFKALIDLLVSEATEEQVARVRVEIKDTDLEKKELLLKNGFTATGRESLLLETTVDELSQIKQFQGKIKGDIVSIDELFTREFRRALTNFIFHGASGLLEDAEYLPMSFYDLELSCCFRTGEKITAMFLVRRTASGILVPVLMYAFEPDGPVKLMMLLRYFVQTAEKTLPGDTKVMICRYSEAVKALSTKLFPDKKGDNVLVFNKEL